jgi:hypothetical protein
MAREWRLNLDCSKQCYREFIFAQAGQLSTKAPVKGEKR